jgi:phenylacetate-CoA ligase
MHKLLERTYQRSPHRLQELALNAYALKIHLQRFGRPFFALSDRWQKTQWWSREALTELQNEQLRILIAHAYDSVPYYRRVMTERRLTPADFKTVHDLPKLPLLTREDVRRHGSELISRKVRRADLACGHTSGTTGSPLQFYWDKQMCLVNNVADWRQKYWAGLKYGEPHAMLLGRTIVPTHQTTPPFWRMNYLHNQLWLSSFHLTEENLQHYVSHLQRFGPVALEGYPSTAYILARYLVRQGRRLPLRAVLTSSETLHQTQRETIEEAFCCKVFDFYGLAERTIFATECEAHAGHHVNMEYGITEVVDAAGEPVADGTMGKLAGTSLHNFAMPFLRYLTSDVSSILRTPCACCRGLPLMADVTTKAEDIVVTKDGRFISPSVLTHPFKPLHSIKLSQIVQEEPDRVVVKIVPDELFSDADAAQLRSALQQRLGAEMRLEIQVVPSIPRTAAGKFRWVISKVPLPL